MDNVTSYSDAERAFNRDVCEFRRLFGLRDFWTNPKKVERAKRGLAHHYLAVACDDQTAKDRIAITFFSTMSEFMRRARMIGFDLDQI